MVNETIRLTRDCEATLIPAGDVVMLEAGALVYVTQALGGTVTVRNEVGLFRVANKDLDALGMGEQEPLFVENDENEEGKPFSEEHVWNAMKTCFDPEIPINIVDLGLIYDMRATEVNEGRYSVEVKMTLTAQGCGMGPAIAEDAKEKIEAIRTVECAKVDIVWEPAWTPHMISDEGRKQLGLE